MVTPPDLPSPYRPGSTLLASTRMLSFAVAMSLAPQPVGGRRDHGVEGRHETTAKNGDRGHAYHHRGADVVTTHITGTSGQRQWQGSEDKRQRGHDNGPETQLRRTDRRLLDRLTQLLALELGEFDDQDGVLGRQPHHDQ